MRRFLIVFVPVLLLIGGLLGYGASPFVAAWKLREAIRTSDTATIERKVDWPRLRESLKVSLARNSTLRREADVAGAEVKPTLWQRVKSAFGATMVDRFVESYVTPQGLPKLFAAQKTWNSKVKGVDESKMSFEERVRDFYARVKRAEFQSLTAVEIEVADKATLTRHVIARLELSDMEWRLVAVSFKEAGATAETTAGLPAP